MKLWLSVEVVLLELLRRDEAVVLGEEMAGEHPLRGQRQRADLAAHPLGPHPHLNIFIMQAFRSGSPLDSCSLTCWIRIRMLNTAQDPDPSVYKKGFSLKKSIEKP